MSASIWLPGRGYTDLAATRVNTLVNEYDDRLAFGRNLDTGQWCVYVATGPTTPPLPILGFDEIPTDNELVLRELYKRDAVRRGTEIVDAIQRNNDEIHAAQEAASNEAAEYTAEAMEFANRKMGKDTGRHVSTAPRSGPQIGGYN